MARPQEDQTKQSLEQLLQAPRHGLTRLPYTAEMRAAQMISVLVMDPSLAARVAAAFERYRTQKTESPGAGVAGGDFVGEAFGQARTKAWVCFYLARALGKIRYHESTDLLLAALDKDPPEGILGYETPPSAVVYKAVTPFYRAAAAYALGRIGDTRAIPSLTRAMNNFDNALDVRHHAARALGLLSVPSDRSALERLALSYPEIGTARALLATCARAKPSAEQNQAY